MSNFQLVYAYDEKMAVWLRERGYPHPPVKAGNTVPTTHEMKWALEAQDDLIFDWPSGEEYLSVRKDGLNGSCFSIEGFDWEWDGSIPGDYFTMRGAEVALKLLITLCQRCGQLLIYPDSGAPAIILDASMDAEEVYDLYMEACQRVDAWEYFFTCMYDVAADS